MLALALCSLMLAGAATVMAEENSRITVTTQGLKSAVATGQGIVSVDEHEAPSTTGIQSGKSRGGAQAISPTHSTSTPNTDFWFYAADVQLFGDYDGDGYYYGIDLLFDADTVYTTSEVYAVVYLSLEGGPWEEYAETENFTILGASADDEYVIVTELVSGYPTGSYDILIELFDAWDDTFVADFGPASTSELYAQPLEDSERDAPASTTVVVHEGGGSTGLLMLLGLVLIALRRYSA